MKQVGEATVETNQLADDLVASAAPQLFRYDLEAAVREVSALRAVLEDQGFPGVEQRLGQLEQTMQVVAAGTQAVIETVRNFEAIISVGMVQRINDLIEQRLTVVSTATERMQRARRRQTVWALLAIVMLALLVAEIMDNGASALFSVAGRTVQVLLVDLIAWSRDLARP